MSYQKKIDELKNLLNDERGKFYDKKVALDAKIKTVNENLITIETQLANERATYSKEKEILYKKLADERKIGKVKKKQMKKWYDEIRIEMTNLWESSKRQARLEEIRLRKKCTSKITTMKSQVANLENESSVETKRLTSTTKEWKSKYLEDLKIRDALIAKLEGGIIHLRKFISDNDEIIKKKNQQLKVTIQAFVN